jgi:uncharacterized damage-inducible protein DinB
MEQGTATELGNRAFFIRRWSQEYPAFIDVLKALPEGQLDYRPHSASRSAGELVSLLVAIARSCLMLCETEKSSFNTELLWHSATGSASLADMIADYEKHHKDLAEKLESMDQGTWTRVAWLKRGEQEILLKDTVGGLMWLALFDAVHHRGQLSTYIRPMGGKVPSIYGPSGDAPAREPQNRG